MPRVLIIDAEESSALAALLAVEGFEVAMAAAGDEAIGILESPGSADLAVIDLMMPDVNGLDLARRIRREFPHVRVVLTSAYHLSARQLELADCGAVGFVPKPYRLTELCSFLRAKVRAVSAATC
jgi:DNA-binding response OmpR family regulator